MKRSEIINTLENLVYFKDVEITHTFENYTLTYCKRTKSFFIKNNLDGITESYTDIESCTKALFKLLNKTPSQSAR